MPSPPRAFPSSSCREAARLADEVRACQSRLGFGDAVRAPHGAARHGSARLGRGRLAARLHRGRHRSRAARCARARRRRGLGALCLDRRTRTDLESSWRLTSDSLALWLSRRLGAARCYLIKSIARPKAPRLSARQLAREGVVDEAFADMLAETGMPTLLLGRGDHEAFAASFADGATFAVRGCFGLTLACHARPKCRASTNFYRDTKTWMAGTSPAMTR